MSFFIGKENIMRREIEVVSFVNDRHAVAVRNRRAMEYSRKLTTKEKFRIWERKHEDGLLLLSGFGLFVTLLMLYFVGVIL